MAVTVGTLIVDLQANTASFVSGMDKAGQIALTNTKNITKAFEAMAEGVGTAILAVEGALAEMVDKAIENDARLYDMAQATGVSVAALSGLEYAAKQSGVSTEALDKGLEKLSKSMLAAATGTGKGADAFKQLGVNVTDSQGKLRPTQDVLADLAAKFQSLPDGPLKTASAIAIFGKAGADLVPLLNRGKDGITDLIAEAKRLGVVIDDDTAAAAKKFEESMNKLKAAVEGAGNKLTTALLPQLQMVIDNISAGAEESNSRFSALLTAAAFVGKAFVVAFSGVQTFFDSLGDFIKHLGAATVIVFGGIADAATQALKGNFSAAKSDIAQMNAALADNNRASAAEQTKIWQDYANGVSDFWNATVDKIAKKPVSTATAPAPANKAAENFEKTITERIAKLQAQSDAEGKLANAIKSTTDATVVATAAAEAQKTVDDLNAQGIKVHVQVTQQQSEAIQRATLLLGAYKSALDANKQLEAQVVKTKEAITSTQQLAVAYTQGAEAVEAAQEKAKLTPFAKQVSDLENLITTLKGLGATDKQLAPLQSALVQLKSKFDDLSSAIHTEAAASELLKLNETTNQMNIQIASLQGYAKAVLGGAAALRDFNAEQQVQAFARANPLLDAAQLEVYRQKVLQTNDAEMLKANAEKIAVAANLGNIQDQINQLNKYHDQIVTNAQQQIAFDAQIHTLELQKQKDMDDLLLKTGGVAAGFKVFFDEYLHDGTTAAQKVKDIMTSTITDFTNTLADGLAKGKLNFQNFVDSVESMLLKLALNNLFKSLIGLGLGFLNNSDFFSSLGGGNIFGSGGVFGGGHAQGGPVTAGSIYEVGEQGKEWFVPSTAGSIVPNTRMGTLANGAGPQGQPIVINQNIQVQTPDADSFKRSSDQVAGMSFAAAMRAARRTG